MANDHGLSGLFGQDGEMRSKEPAKPAVEPETEADLPPVLDDADKSPLAMLADKIGLEEEQDVPPAAPAEPPAPVAEAAPEPEPVATAEVEDTAVAEPALDDDQVYDPFGAAMNAAEAEEAPAQEPETLAAAVAAAAPAAEPKPPAPEEKAHPNAGPISRRQIGPRLGPEARGHKAFTAEAMPNQGGILCFLVMGGDGKGRRRTLEALNVAAGNGGVRLRALPHDAETMDEVLDDALATTDCAYVAFLSSGTEPADDWANECAAVFRDLPRAAGVSVRAANSDPLSPWARVAFFMDEAERHDGRSGGFDTMVFRLSALQELEDKLGPAIRNGRLIAAVEGRGHEIAEAAEARVTISTPSDRKEAIKYVREKARMAARASARRKNFLIRPFIAMGIVMGYPFRILKVRKAAKHAVGSTQFREVASKAAAAVFADRRVRAWTMLFPGKDVS